MPHSAPLITTIAGGFAAAWVLGLLARRLGLAPIVGYLLAGIVIGPYTPGFVGDAGLAAQLAEIGVVLLMFGVGIHFHPKDLLAVKHIAVPGALVALQDLRDRDRARERDQRPDARAIDAPPRMYFSRRAKRSSRLKRKDSGGPSTRKR